MGVLHIPDGAGPFPTVILLHGLWSNKDRPNYTKLSGMLCSDGYVAFRIDMFGHGESEGSIEDVTISLGVEGLNAALKFIKQQGFVDKSRLGLYGASYGGAVAIAGFKPEFKVVILFYPSSNYIQIPYFQLGKESMKKWERVGWAIISGKHKLKWDFYQDLLDNHHDQYKEAEKITSPTLIIHGDLDETVPLSHNQELCKHLKPKNELAVILGGNHAFKGQDALGDKARKIALKWFKKYLK